MDLCHYNDVIKKVMASQITSLTIVYSTIYSRRRSKKTWKLCVTGICVGNSPVTDEFPAQRASNPENGSIWWRHHGKSESASVYYPASNVLNASIHWYVQNSTDQNCHLAADWSHLIMAAERRVQLRAGWQDQHWVTIFCSAKYLPINILKMSLCKHYGVYNVKICTIHT